MSLKRVRKAFIRPMVNIYSFSSEHSKGARERAGSLALSMRNSWGRPDQSGVSGEGWGCSGGGAPNRKWRPVPAVSYQSRSLQNHMGRGSSLLSDEETEAQPCSGRDWFGLFFWFTRWFLSTLQQHLETVLSGLFPLPAAATGKSPLGMQGYGEDTGRPIHGTPRLSFLRCLHFRRCSCSIGSCAVVGRAFPPAHPLTN